MRRIKIIVAMAAVLVGMLALQAGPAMADDLDCRDANRFEHRFDVDAVNCDGDVYVDRGEFDFNDNEDFFFDDNEDFFLNPFEVDVDTEEVNEDSDLEGECVVTEIDWDEDGLISDWEIEVTCFVEDDD